MGLAANQVQLLMLTARKSDVEFGLSMDSMKKMALTREQAQLSKEYYSRLQSKNLAYYANGQYNKLNYSYLMGTNAWTLINSGSTTVKTKNSMILTDHTGRVVLSDEYAKAIKEITGISTDSSGKGPTFSLNTQNAAQIIELFSGKAYKAEKIQSVLEDEDANIDYEISKYNTQSLEKTGETTMTSDVTEKIEAMINFYLPIIKAAAANGWTTEYNEDIKASEKTGGNEDYINDAILSGVFQLASVDSSGNYNEDASLTYFVTSGQVISRNDSETRAEITAWYDAQKDILATKEDALDLDMENLNTELNAITKEIDSISSLIQNAVSSVFDWGSSGA